MAATLTRQVERLLADTFPQAERVATASLHRAVPTARHAFLDVPGGEDKASRPRIRPLFPLLFHRAVPTARHAFLDVPGGKDKARLPFSPLSFLLKNGGTPPLSAFSLPPPRAFLPL